MYEFEESILNEKNILANRHFMKNQREDSNDWLHDSTLFLSGLA
jgi:hypothetical protein